MEGPPSPGSGRDRASSTQLRGCGLGQLDGPDHRVPIGRSNADVEAAAPTGLTATRLNVRPVYGSAETRLSVWFWVEPDRSNFRALRQLEGIFDIDAEVADGALYLGMPKKDLNGPQVACRLVDDRRLRAPERVRPVVLGLEPDPGHPLPD